MTTRANSDMTVENQKDGNPETNGSVKPPERRLTIYERLSHRPDLEKLASIVKPQVVDTILIAIVEDVLSGVAD